MNPRPYTKVIRDAVRGDLNFKQHEMDIMHTREFQRLNKINQLGTTYLVYPSATHNRFNHSIGTCGVARDIIHSINSKYHQAQKKINDEQEDLICLAALLHDILTIPFGHTIEDEYPILGPGDRRHDDEEHLSEFLGDETAPIGNILKHTFGGDTASKVAKIISAKNEEQIKTLSIPFGADIVGNTICADLLDYLARDIYYTGLCDRYDYQRILSSYDIFHNRLIMDLRHTDKIIRRGLLSEMLKLLNMRYTLAERVYYDRTKAMASAMIGRAMAYGIKGGVVSFEELKKLTDEELFFKLENGNKNDEAITASMLIQKLKRRALFRPAWELDHQQAQANEMKEKLIADYHENPENRFKKEDEIAKDFDIPKGGVLIYCPKEDMSAKKAEVLVRWPSSSVPTKLCEVDDYLIEFETRLLNEKHPHLWRMYVLLDPDWAHKEAEVHNRCVEMFSQDEYIKKALMDQRIAKRLTDKGLASDLKETVSFAAETGVDLTNISNEELDRFVEKSKQNMKAKRKKEKPEQEKAKQSAIEFSDDTKKENH